MCGLENLSYLLLKKKHLIFAAQNPILGNITLSE